MLFLLAVSLLLYQQVAGQIPGLCVTNGQPNSNRICCPSPNIPNAGACGSNLSPSRGSCSPLSAILPNLVINAAGDTRENWPYYFDYLCKCNGNYWGYDCSQCAFGYTMVGGICTRQQVPRKRKSTADLTIAERKRYLNAISQSKLNSGYTRYMAIRKESNPPEVVQLSLYNLFAWLHYYAGKDNDLLRNNDCKEKVRDYGHEASGFLTWHRILLLWFEREIQIMINDDSFSLPYWDWTKPENRKSVLSNDWYGSSVNGNIQGRFAAWQTICWNKADLTCDRKGILCDPTITTGLLRRCPVDAACNENSRLWPTQRDVDVAASAATQRDSVNNSCGSDNALCNKGIERKLHNAGHIILGMGGFLNMNGLDPGTMSSVPASANDPIFLSHHTMIDFIFEQWLTKNPTASYVGPETRASYPTLKGHGPTDVLVPFIPLVNNNQAFQKARVFGYQYVPCRQWWS
ncbi:hypothetical protein EMCRGX_G004856 [Ephydatia muelleri]